MEFSPETITFVEEIQKATYNPNVDKRRTDPKLIEKVKAAYERLRSNQEKVGMAPLNVNEILDYVSGRSVPQPPSKYQVAWHYDLMMRRWGEVHLVAEKIKKTISYQPLLASTLTGRMNARLLNAPHSGEVVLLFESDIFLMGYLFSKYLAELHHSKIGTNGQISLTIDERDLTKTGFFSDSVVDLFSECLAEIVLSGNPRNIRPYIGDALTEHLSDQYITTFELFVMGHEYAHCAFKHIEPLGAGRIAQSREAVNAWAQEYEADALGCFLTIGAMAEKGKYFELTWVGIVNLFKMFEFIDRAIFRFYNTGDSYDEHVEAIYRGASHPPPQARLENISREVRAEFLRSGNKDLVSLIDQYNIYFSKYYKTLWNRINDVLPAQFENRKSEKSRFRVGRIAETRYSSRF